MNAPRTSREALIAEMLGDLDTLLNRINALPTLVTSAEEKIYDTVTALNNAGEKYRIAVTAFNEQSKADLTEYFENQTVKVLSKTAEEQRAAMLEAARMAFDSEASKKTANLSLVLSEAAKDFRRSIWLRLVEHAVTALIASSFTAGLVYLILK
jgi:predicted lipid-binding transport protein (Tim44 family)